MSLNSDLANCDAATSRSSAKRVAGVVSKFCDFKKELVCEIGFSGILHMPQINKLPRKFTVWLLSKVDVASRTIVVEGRTKVHLSDQAFHRVLGIPCGPKLLMGLQSNELQEKMDFIKLVLGSISLDPLETCSLKVAEDVITMEYKNGMNKEQRDRFKVAFVVFVVGHFLVAKTRTNHGMDDYWGSLLNADEIHHYNFCSLVIEEIVESAKRVQEELRCNRQVKNVTGCTLGLQVLYLDSLKMVGYSLPAEHVPRIGLFDLGLLNKMIGADQGNTISYSHTENSDNSSKTESILKKKVHFEARSSSTHQKCPVHTNEVHLKAPQPAVSTYLTAYLRGSLEQKLSYGQIDALKWHNARMTQHVRKTKEVLLEVGPINCRGDGFRSIIEVHMEALMAKIFQDNLAMAQRLHKHASANSTPCEKISMRTTSLNLSSDRCKTLSDGQSSVGGMSATASDNSISNLQGSEDFNIYFASTPVTDKGSLVQPAMCVKRLHCKQKRIAPDPWKLGVPKKAVTIDVTNYLHVWLQNNTMSTLRSNYVIHALPKYIELDGYILKDIFIKRNNFTPEALDIAIRRIAQLDSDMYGKARKLCWRHIMESDFAMDVLTNKDPLKSVSIIDQFTMRFNDYDISECRMIIIPAHVNESWCVYFWDMEELRVHIIDPLYENYEAEPIEKLHKKNIEEIQKCLCKIVALLFDGWYVKWAEFRSNFVKPIMATPKSGSDGLLTLLAIQKFDGAKFVEDVNEEKLGAFSKLVLYEMVSLSDNYGIRPDGYIETIN